MTHEPTLEPSLLPGDTNQFAAAQAPAGTLPERIEANSKQKSEERVDYDLIDKTRIQIRNLVSEIAELAKSGCETAEFFEGFLIRTTSALASEGGAVWLDETGNGQLALQYHVNLDQTCLAKDSVSQLRHSLLLNRLRDSGEPSLVPANSGAPGDDQPGNPTDKLLIVGPLTVNNNTVGLIEIFQRTGAGPTTQRGYLRFLNQMCEVASDFLKNHQIRNFACQQALWSQLDSFVKAIHQGLDPDQTAYVIANEGRRIIGCDRVSVVLRQGGRCLIRAVSGLDSIERRADQVKELQQLTSAVVRAGEPLWYDGDDQDLSPQIEQQLHRYIDRSHSKMVAIIPLVAVPAANRNTQPTPTETTATIGALVVEQLKDSAIEGIMRKRAEVVAGHGQTALSNAIEHHSLFLMPLWKALGKFAKPFTGTRLPKTLLGLGLLGGIVAFFALFPYPFSLSSNGQLQPRIQNEVFAKVSGILQEVHIPTDEPVRIRMGDVLAQMSNNDLEVQIQNLEGQINQTDEQIRTFRRAQSERREKIDDIMLNGELSKAEEALKSFQRELQLKKKMAADLTVRSPADGLVVNWQVRRSLLKRPVDRGQNLMTVVDPDGGWQLELEIPERRMGHLLERIQSTREPVRVSFALVSHPGSEFTGELIHIDEKLEVYSEDGNCVKAMVAFDNTQLPTDLLKSGTRINARLNCGTRSIGFVWFHELFETVESAWNNWF